MIDYLYTQETLHARNVTFSDKQYMFVLLVVMGENESVAYALTHDAAEFKRVIGSADEDAFLFKCKKEADLLMQQQECTHLKEHL